MAVLSLPLTFSNSFWSEDYRKGLEVLYTELEKVSRRVLFPCVINSERLMVASQLQGIAENSEIAKFIRVSRLVLPRISPRIFAWCIEGFREISGFAVLARSLDPQMLPFRIVHSRAHIERVLRVASCGDTLVPDLFV